MKLIEVFMRCIRAVREMEADPRINKDVTRERAAQQLIMLHLDPEQEMHTSWLVLALTLGKDAEPVKLWYHKNHGWCRELGAATSWEDRREAKGTSNILVASDRTGGRITLEEVNSQDPTFSVPVEVCRPAVADEEGSEDEEEEEERDEHGDLPRVPNNPNTDPVEYLKTCIRSFEELAERHSNFGARDTEPDGVLQRLLWEAAVEVTRPCPPTDGMGWNLYSMDGADDAAMELHNAAMELHNAAESLIDFIRNQQDNDRQAVTKYLEDYCWRMSI